MTELFLKHHVVSTAVLMLTMLGPGWSWCQDRPEVTVVTAAVANVAPSESFAGTVFAPAMLEMEPKITGRLAVRHLRTGAAVREGDLIFSLDPAPFEQALEEARTRLAMAQNALSAAEVNHSRARQNAQVNAVARYRLGPLQAALHQARDRVDAQKAALATAQAMLADTDIRAPFDGYLGAWRRPLGARVGPGLAPVVRLFSLNPVHVRLDVSQARIEPLLRTLRHAPGRHVVEVETSIEALSLPEANKMIVVKSGEPSNLALYAEVANPEGLLLDGVDARVRMRSRTGYKVVVLPRAAIQRDAAGTFVQIIGKDGTVKTVRVDTGLETGLDAGQKPAPGTEDLVTVTAGLAPGARVIVAGLNPVREGMMVTPRTSPNRATTAER